MDVLRLAAWGGGSKDMLPVRCSRVPLGRFKLCCFEVKGRLGLSAVDTDFWI